MSDEPAGYVVTKTVRLPSGRVQVTVVDDHGHLFNIGVSRDRSVPEAIDEAVRAYQATLGCPRERS